MFDPASLALSSLEGKIAVVTGSTQGLGEAIAHLFAERGIPPRCLRCKFLSLRG